MILKPLTDHRWRGYSLEELEEQRVLNDARILMVQRSLKKKFENMTPGADAEEDGSGLLSKIFKYVDYVVLGITVFRKLRPLLRNLRKKSQ